MTKETTTGTTRPLPIFFSRVFKKLLRAPFLFSRSAGRRQPMLHSFHVSTVRRFPSHRAYSSPSPLPPDLQPQGRLALLQGSCFPLTPLSNPYFHTVTFPDGDPQEWARAPRSAKAMADDHKLMFGFLFSLKQLVNKMAPRGRGHGYSLSPHRHSASSFTPPPQLGRRAPRLLHLDLQAALL